MRLPSRFLGAAQPQRDEQSTILGTTDSGADLKTSPVPRWWYVPGRGSAVRRRRKRKIG